MARGEGTKRETWRDWQHPEAQEPDVLLTRDEVLARVANARPGLTETKLRYLEYRGVVPHPVRQSHQGRVRAVYPEWMAQLLWQLLIYQDKYDQSLEEIAPLMRALARLLSLSPPHEAINARLRELGLPTLTINLMPPPHVPMEVSPALASATRQILALFALQHEPFGVKIRRGEIVLYDDDGIPIVYSFPVENAADLLARLDDQLRVGEESASN